MNISQDEKLTKILFDTNIFSYFSNPIFSSQIKVFLQKFIKKGTKFAISETSIFELLQAASEVKEKQGFQLLNQFKSFSIDKDVLTRAARLAGLYQKYGGINIKGFDTGDLYIAATSVINFSSILTANQKDY